MCHYRCPAACPALQHLARCRQVRIDAARTTTGLPPTEANSNASDFGTLGPVCSFVSLVASLSLDAGLVCTGDWSLVSCCEEISTDLSDCCPKLLKLSDVKYCSDQDVVIVKAKVAGFFEQISLQKASCGNETIVV
ncbi:Kinesin-like protein KIF3A [Durusdinium trenchii]|uniref:Kinesin-like protein KIF3A n=1 Tax=Durusdinium trenchii TaxID=1381693 RepID=A0ABP0L471_9DINO